MSPEAYISQYWQAAASAAAGTGLFPSVFIAQAGLEGGWGASELARKYNNHFGVKAIGGWAGPSVNMWTDEYEGGVKVRRYEPFRVYANPYESFKDRAGFLLVNPRYRSNGVFSAQTPEEQAYALQRAGYATDPNYAGKIIGIIEKYGLKKYDGYRPGLSAGAAAAGATALAGLGLYIWYTAK